MMSKYKYYHKSINMSEFWTYKESIDARNHYQFIYGNKRIYITEAQRLWLQDPSIIFQTGYRIAGRPEDVASTLTSQGVNDKEVKKVLDTSISSVNYTGPMSLEYQRELTGYHQRMRDVIHSADVTKGFTLMDVIAQTNPELLVNIKSGKQAKGLGMTIVPAGKVRGVDIVRNVNAESKLNTRLAQLPEGNVLDVSRLLPNGSGARSIKDPGQKLKKVKINSLKIVSDNFPAIDLALSMLLGGKEKYKKEREEAAQKFNVNLETFDVPTIEIEAIPQEVSEIASIPLASDVQIEPTFVYPIYSQGQRRQMKRQRLREEEKKNIAVTVSQAPTTSVGAQILATEPSRELGGDISQDILPEMLESKYTIFDPNIVETSSKSEVEPRSPLIARSPSSLSSKTVSSPRSPSLKKKTK